MTTGPPSTPLNGSSENPISIESSSAKITTPIYPWGRVVRLDPEETRVLLGFCGERRIIDGLCPVVIANLDDEMEQPLIEVVSASKTPQTFGQGNFQIDYPSALLTPLNDIGVQPTLLAKTT